MCLEQHTPRPPLSRERGRKRCKSVYISHMRIHVLRLHGAIIMSSMKWTGGYTSYDILKVPCLLVRYGTNHPSRRRHLTLNAITNDHTVAALRMTSLITRVRKPDVIHEMDRCAALVGTLRMTIFDSFLNQCHTRYKPERSEGYPTQGDGTCLQHPQIVNPKS